MGDDFEFLRMEDQGPRYLVLHHDEDVRLRGRERTGRPTQAQRLDPSGPFHVHGGDNPTLFRTLSNAMKVARYGNSWSKAVLTPPPRSGRVLLFNANYLPVVADEGFDGAALGRISYADFCERQIQAWAVLADRARAGEQQWMPDAET